MSRFILANRMDDQLYRRGLGRLVSGSQKLQRPKLVRIISIHPQMQAEEVTKQMERLWIPFACFWV